MKYKLSFLSALIGLSIISATIHAMQECGIMRFVVNVNKLKHDDFVISLNGKRRSKDECIILAVLRNMKNICVGDVNRFDCRICVLPDEEQSSSSLNAVARVGDDNYYVGINKLPLDSPDGALLVVIRPDMPFPGSDERKAANEYYFRTFHEIFHRYINR